MKIFFIPPFLVSLVLTCFCCLIMTTQSLIAQELNNSATSFAPSSLSASLPEKPFLRPEVSISVGTLHYWLFGGRTTIGGAATFGVLFPFNMYLGVELSGFYGNSLTMSFWDQELQTQKFIPIKQEHTHLAAFMQLGYDIELGAAFMLRPYLLFGRNTRYYGVIERVAVSPNSWVEAKAQTYHSLELTPGVLATYSISDNVRLGINLRANVSAALTAQFRW